MFDENMYKAEEIDDEKLKKISSKIINDEKLKFQFYDKLRKKLSDKIPDLNKPESLEIKDFLFLLPDFFILFTRLFIDKRVPTNKKIILSCILGYLVMPIDIIPDFIPVIGYLDDFIIAVLGVDMLLSDIDSDIIADNWPGKQNILELLRFLIDKIENSIHNPLLRNIKLLLKKFGGSND